MACRSVAARCHVDLARVGPGIRDELGNRLRQERWVYRHNEGDRVDAGDGCDVAEEVEIEFLVKRRIDRGRGADHSHWPIRRALMSVDPPAANGTTMRTG